MFLEGPNIKRRSGREGSVYDLFLCLRYTLSEKIMGEIHDRTLVLRQRYLDFVCEHVDSIHPGESPRRLYLARYRMSPFQMRGLTEGFDGIRR